MARNGLTVARFVYDRTTKRVVPVGQAQSGLVKTSGRFKPLASDALAVLPSQRIEAMQDAEAKGVKTHFDESGSPVFESRGHRKRYCEAYGVFDRNGGYGDPQPR